jgi:exodeoxyribonuclease VII large subunit
MPRLPFDPDRVAGPTPSVFDQDVLGERPELGPSGRERRRAVSAAEPAQLTVSQASDLIKNTLEQRLASPLRVVGEVSNLSPRNHWYFSLKDQAAVLQCVAWATTAKKFGFTPKDGDEVVATGHVSHYGPQGRTQLYVSDLQPVGAGALELRFRALCEELRQLGYFEETRKKRLPLLPRRIAVITSLASAAVQDVIATARQRCKAVGLVLVDVRVQGDGAAQDVAKAIAWVDRHQARLGVDAILVTRGGGSIEDLWAFNERVVADAVLKCRLPLVAAIGHESDTTIIELVADWRGSTPTQAVMRLIPSEEDLCRQINHLTHRLGSLIARRLERERGRLEQIRHTEFFRNPMLLVRAAAQRLDRLQCDLRRNIMLHLADERLRVERLAGQLGKRQPGAWLAQRRTRLEGLRVRLERGAAMHLRRHRDRLDGLQRHLNAMDPHGVLNRGYSLTTDRAGKLIRSVGQVQSGQLLVTRLADGSIESVAGTLTSRDVIRRNGIRRRDHSATEQPGLFDFTGKLGQTNGT